jgi:hypothetical protein
LGRPGLATPNAITATVTRGVPSAATTNEGGSATAVSTLPGRRAKISKCEASARSATTGKAQKRKSGKKE